MGQLSRRGWIRTFILAVIAGALIWFASTRSLLSIFFFAASVIVWLVFEAVPGLKGASFRSPIALPSERESDDYGRQLAALMGMRLNEAPLIRARAALMFPDFQLAAQERASLVRWATFALAGGEIAYEIEPIPGWEGRWRVQCHVDHSPQPLTGAIESQDAHRIVEAHRAMVARLLEERRPR